MDLEKYVKNFDFKKIIKIEESDRQFLALKNSWKKIKKIQKNKNLFVRDGRDLSRSAGAVPLPITNNQLLITNLFLFLILQNALISYQIAWSWERWWEEFASKIVKDRDRLQQMFEVDESNVDRWYKFITSSKHNKRIYNIKIGRLKRFEEFKNCLKKNSFEKYYNDMEKLLYDIAQTMGNWHETKTLTFAIKMFGYGARIVFKKFIPYPDNIKIPVDSRLIKIYESNFKHWEKLLNFDEHWKGRNKKINEKKIQDYFHDLAKKNKIPALHLDSLLWIKYRGEYF